METAVPSLLMACFDLLVWVLGLPRVLKRPGTLISLRGFSSEPLSTTLEVTRLGLSVLTLAKTRMI